MWDPHHIILMSGADTPREKPVGARRSRPSTVSLASFTGGNVTASCSVWELQMSLQSNRFLTTAQIFWVNPFEPINDYKIIEPFWNQCFFFCLFSLKVFFLPSRPASTSSSTSSSLVGSSHWPQEARTRRSSECASTSSSCPFASSSRRRTKAPAPSHKRRCVCPRRRWRASTCLSPSALVFVRPCL